MKRLFIAIKINPSNNLINIYEKLQKLLHYDSIRWCSYENLHLTLKFLGNTPSEKIPKIVDIVKDVNNNIEPHNITINGIGVFGRRYNPKVIWCGIEKNEQIIKAHNLLIENLKDVGIYPDRQNFVPHLTLARINNIRDKIAFTNFISSYKDVEIQSSPANDIYLYESKLQYKAPPIYIKIE